MKPSLIRNAFGKRPVKFLLPTPETKFTVSLEEIATGVAAPEVEHVIYGRLLDLGQLARASHMEKQEQWEVKVPKTNDNATRGTIRVRKTMIEGSPDEYTLCGKTPAGDASNPLERKEVPIPCTQDMFDVIKSMASAGMRKDRYFFPATATGEVIPHDAANLGDPIPEDQATDAAHAEGDKWVMPLKDAVTEHKDLVNALESPDKSDDQKEIAEQGGELKRMEAAEAEQENVATEGDTVDMINASSHWLPELDFTKQPGVFKKQEVVVEAIIWTGKNLAQVQAFLSGNAKAGEEIVISEDDGNADTDGELLIDTLEDGEGKQVQHIASPGDYIIKGVKGEFYPCKPDIFAETYAQTNLVTLEELPPEGVEAEPTGEPSEAPAQAAQELSTNASPLQSPQAEPEGLVWEVDLFLKEDGSYYDWVKIDLEVGKGNENMPLPPLPLNLSDIIAAPYGQRTEAEEATVSNLYSTIFVTRNPGATPLSTQPTPAFDQSKVAEDGTPAEGTPADSNGTGAAPEGVNDVEVDPAAKETTEEPTAGEPPAEENAPDAEEPPVGEPPEEATPPAEDEAQPETQPEEVTEPTAEAPKGRQQQFTDDLKQALGQD
jgi:hypothetical protein